MWRLISVDGNVIESHHRIRLQSVFFFLLSDSVCIIKGIRRQNGGSSGKRTFSTELPLLTDPSPPVETNRELRVRVAPLCLLRKWRKKKNRYQRETPLWGWDGTLRNTSTALHPPLSPVSSRPISPSHLTSPLNGGDKQCASRVPSSSARLERSEAERTPRFSQRGGT